MASFFHARAATGLEQRFEPRFNVAPTTDLLGLAVWRSGERLVDAYRWGLVPSWAKDPSVGNRLFNARAERVATNAAFRAAFRLHRLAVVVDGYWEWRKGPGRARQPYYLHRADGHPIALAGLYESWRDPTRPENDPDAWLRTCTIITTDASPDLAEVHDRMPVVLDPSVVDRWIDRERRDIEALERILRPTPVGLLDFYPVDPRVGDVRNDDERLLDPLPRPAEASDVQATLL